VRQRRVELNAPWHAAGRLEEALRRVSLALGGLTGSTDAAVATVDGEVCAYAYFERGDERFRWYVLQLGAGSPRLNATDEVSIELWSAVLEEGVVMAGEAGARRLFAFVEPDTAAYEALRLTGFAGYSRYYILRGTHAGDERGMSGLREQHESDLWSIHQLYNRVTPRGVQFAEAFTSDAWSTDVGGRGALNRAGPKGYVVPMEDGIGVACQIIYVNGRPVVTFLCDEPLYQSVAGIVGAALARAQADGDADVVVPGYQHHLIHQFLESGYWIHRELIGTVRHTTVPAVVQGERFQALAMKEARSAVSVSYRQRTAAMSDSRAREGAS
jgi:hypothetical protein